MSQHLPARVQAGVRVLEDHLHAPAQRAQVGHCGGGVLAVEEHAAARRRVQARPAGARRCSCRSPIRRPAPACGPCAIVKLTPSTACTNWRGLRSTHAVQPGRRDVEDLGQVAAPRTSGGVMARPPRSTSQQAARVAPASSRSGRSRAAALASTCGQRGLKAQPAGIAFRRGIAPSICSRRSRSSSIAGIEPIRPTRVGVRRAVDDVGHRADLGDAAGVHHGHAVAGLGDHAHVVRDQHHRRAMLLAQALEQRNDLRLDRHVERRRRLVGDDQLAARRPAPARSRRAGACRR